MTAARGLNLAAPLHPTPDEFLQRGLCTLAHRFEGWMNRSMPISDSLFNGRYMNLSCVSGLHQIYARYHGVFIGKLATIYHLQSSNRRSEIRFEKLDEFGGPSVLTQALLGPLKSANASNQILRRRHTCTKIAFTPLAAVSLTLRSGFPMIQPLSEKNDAKGEQRANRLDPCSQSVPDGRDLKHDRQVQHCRYRNNDDCAQRTANDGRQIPHNGKAGAYSRHWQ